jgi:hypothetical protein
MSDLFLKNNLKKNLNMTESSFNISNILDNNKLNNNSITSTLIPNSIIPSTTSNQNQNGGQSATSSANMSKINVKDINNLINMLTSESPNHTATNELQDKLSNLLQKGGDDDDDLENKLTDQVNTELLENKLKNIINQNGGSLNTENLDTEMLENKMSNYINQKGGDPKTLLTLGGLLLAGTVAKSNENKKNSNSSATESEFSTSKIDRILSRPSRNSKLPTVLEESRSRNMNHHNNDYYNNNDRDIFMKHSSSSPEMMPIAHTTTSIANDDDEFSATSSEMPYIHNKQTSNKDQRLFNLTGGRDLPVALQEFQKIIKLAMDELDINRPKAMKIASSIQKAIKEDDPNIKVEKLLDAAKQELSKNKSKYTKLLSSL